MITFGLDMVNPSEALINNDPYIVFSWIRIVFFYWSLAQLFGLREKLI